MALLKILGTESAAIMFHEFEFVTIQEMMRELTERLGEELIYLKPYDLKLGGIEKPLA